MSEKKTVTQESIANMNRFEVPNGLSGLLKVSVQIQVSLSVQFF